MPINALARTIVNKVLHVLDRHTFAAIPDADILEAYSAVAQLLRAERTTDAVPEETTP